MQQTSLLGLLDVFSGLKKVLEVERPAMRMAEALIEVLMTPGAQMPSSATTSQ
jgi:hypothetical protein